MDDTELEKLAEITDKIYSMTFVLCGYCENYEQRIPEFAKLFEFSQILPDTSRDLFDLV
jgi:hypothetical protein